MAHRPHRPPIHQRVAKVVSRFTDRYPFVGPMVWMSATLLFIVRVFVAYSWHSRAVTPKGIVSGPQRGSDPIRKTLTHRVK